MSGQSLDRGIAWLLRHWLLLVNLAMALFIGGTLLPPLLMHLGLEGPAVVSYMLYGLTCHQLPERSYFLFGPDAVNTYSLEKVIAWGADPRHLRGFVGNAQVGFKLGMAQRNTAIYSTFFLAGLAYALLRKRVGGLRWPLFFLLVLPMAIDGGSHVVSEVTGWGFRETNAWLAVLTGDLFPEAFYAGTTLGSLNWWLRTLTGTLFAVACVWIAYPYLGRGFSDTRRQAEAKRARAQARPTPVQAGEPLAESPRRSYGNQAHIDETFSLLGPSTDQGLS